MDRAIASSLACNSSRYSLAAIYSICMLNGMHGLGTTRRLMQDVTGRGIWLLKNLQAWCMAQYRRAQCPASMICQGILLLIASVHKVFLWCFMVSCMAVASWNGQKQPCNLNWRHLRFIKTKVSTEYHYAWYNALDATVMQCQSPAYFGYDGAWQAALQARPSRTKNIWWIVLEYGNLLASSW